MLERFSDGEIKAVRAMQGNKGTKMRIERK